MKVLITGGFGLIAGRLAELFSNSGHDVLLATRRLTVNPISLTNVNIIEIDWEDVIGLESLCAGIDVIVHAAGMNAQDCFRNPTEALYFNGTVTSRFLDAAISQSVPRFIYLSTAHVYSSNLAGVISEKACALNIHPYATSHRAGEDVVLFANQQSKIQGIVTRLSNSFGYPISVETNCWGLLINELSRQAVQQGVISLKTNGSQYRDFVSLTQVCNAILFLTQAEMSSGNQSIFNVGSGVSKSIINVSRLVQKRCTVILGYEPEIIRPMNDSSEEHMPLIYQVEALAQLGYRITDDTLYEIDELLRYSSANFQK